MTTYIDDQDPDRVIYTGTWARGGVPAEYNGTVSSSTRAGDYFTVTFTGTNIAVFGTFDITSENVTTTYTLDNAPPAQVTSQAGSHDTLRQQFWRSSKLEMGTHKLVVNMTKVNSDPQPGEGTVWFDYFLITDPNVPSSEVPNPSPSPPQGAGHKSAPIGAIVGGTIGGSFFLLALAFFYLLYRRRTRIQIIEEKDDYDDLTPVRHHKHMAIEPFVLTSASTSAGTSTSASMEQFNPALLVSGPPPVSARKSVVTARPDTGHSVQTSLGNSTEAALNTSPIADESTSSTSAGGRNADSVTDLSAQHNRRRAKRLQVETDVSTAQSPTSVTQVSGALPMQHIDSGVRAADLAAPSDTAARIELPPVYSPT